MKFYTKSGDRGMTSIVGGKRVSKTDRRISVCGELDELNAHVGMLASLIAATMKKITADKKQELTADMTAIQEQLFHIGTAISASSDCCEAASAVGWLERNIDIMQQETPKIDTFVLPGGCTPAAEAQVCRTVCRRAERGIVGLAETLHVDTAVAQYINRLSDYFFALALYLNFIECVAEKKLYISCK